MATKTKAEKGLCRVKGCTAKRWAHHATCKTHGVPKTYSGPTFAEVQARRAATKA
jgi:hypothetical protein